MKINTDGVLLAAVATHSDPKRILDIGTGTGVIAMMLAQRFDSALIEAVEIDESAALAADRNFSRSPFSARLFCHATSLEAYSSDHKYDLIVSNPPFFVNDLKNPEGRKSLARHADSSFFETVLMKSAELLSANGLLWLILPVKQADLVINSAANYHLFLQHEISICSDVNKPVIRKVICFGNTKSALKRENFYIYKEEGVYTDAYKVLLRDFFLAF